MKTYELLTIFKPNLDAEEVEKAVETLNKVVVADENGVCTSEILPLRAYYGMEATYLQYCLKSHYFYQYVNQLTYGVKMPRLGTEDGKKGLIPIPPLNEQQKIIQKLSKIQEIIEVL